MNDLLHQIIADKRLEIEQWKIETPIDRLQRQTDELPSDSRGEFSRAISRPNRTNIIAELKKGSPSRGIIARQFDPSALARQYRDGGAAALSVLTDQKHFYGSFENLSLARETALLPVLCKDFIIDEYQLYKARIAGAQAVLLIVAALSESNLRSLQEAADRMNLECLVEVHNEAELNLALSCDARIVGVNNRDLNDFSVRLETSERLGPKIPKGVTAVAESGICKAADIERLRRVGFNSFLVGEALVRSSDPAALIKELGQV